MIARRGYWQWQRQETIYSDHLGGNMTIHPKSSCTSLDFLPSISFILIFMQQVSPEELKMLYAAGQRQFQAIDLSAAYLFDADFRGIDLSGSNLTQIYLPYGNLTQSRLQAVQLVEAELGDAKLYQADLSNANLEGANLSRANLRQANLEGANLSRVNLQGADLYKANLRGTNLSNADLTGANLEGASLEGAKLEGSNLFRAQKVDLTGAILDAKTILPSGYRQNFP
jgi:uncharacterized protein YjbI with pentapeptide repeats